MKNCSQKKEMKEEKTQDKAEKKKKHVAVEWWKDLSSIATNSTVDAGLNDKTQHRITIYSQSYPHMSREIILNVKQEEIQQKIPLIWMCSPVTTQPEVWKKAIIFDSRKYCESSVSKIPRGQLTIHQTQADNRYIHRSILAGGSWRLENPNMQRGRWFCCRKPLMQLRETSWAWIILLQFGSWCGSLHYIL